MSCAAMNRSTRSRWAWSHGRPYGPSMTPRQAKGEAANAVDAQAPTANEMTMREIGARRAVMRLSLDDHRRRLDHGRRARPRRQPQLLGRLARHQRDDPI